MAERNEAESAGIGAIARRHGLSESAAQALYAALRHGGGGQAQFSHPELGGMGQWSRGGMTQVGAMFDSDLKARVAAACQELSQLLAGDAAPGRDSGSARDAQPAAAAAREWWPEALGTPASTGAQNDMRYACFPEERRLAIQRGGAVTVYDTGRYRLTGFSQQQSGEQSLVFSGPDGTVGLEAFRVV